MLLPSLIIFYERISCVRLSTQGEGIHLVVFDVIPGDSGDAEPGRAGLRAQRAQQEDDRHPAAAVPLAHAGRPAPAALAARSH